MPISTTSSRYAESVNRSLDADQLRFQNLKLNEQVKELFQHLNQLLIINEELNCCLQQKMQQSIKQNQTARNNYQNINQQEIQALAYQILQLQNQLEIQKNKNANHSPNDQNLQQTILVITQLTNSFQIIQSEYQSQISRLQQQLSSKRSQFQNLISATQSKYQKLISQYNQLIISNKEKDEQMQSLQHQLKECLKKSINNGRDEKLKQPLKLQFDEIQKEFQQKINQKNRVIKIYEDVLEKLKLKIKQQDK